MELVYLALGAVALSLLWIWRSAYPKPYAGIPYHQHSAKRLWGDLPDLIASAKVTKSPAKFVFSQCQQLGSPVIQLFLRPFTRPFIVISDVREVNDIMTNRTKEFDRAPSTIDFLGPFVPESSIVKFTTHEFRTQRRLWSDIMTQDFLRRVASARVHEAAQSLVRLLATRATIAQGRPFAVAEDFELAALDAIWGTLLGSRLEGVEQEISMLKEGANTIRQPDSLDAPALMPPTVRGDLYKAMNYFNETIGRTLTSPMPKWHLWFLRHLAPEYRRHWAVKCRTVDGLIRTARARFASFSADRLSKNDDETCAMDHVLRREHAIVDQNSSQEEKFPTTQEIHDELFMFLIVGHDTTATTLSWAVKLLTNHPTAQEKLRTALQTAFPHCGPGAGPSAEEIISTDVPYLDACLEEIWRVGHIVPRLVRRATVDTQVLGFFIPKGAHIMCNTYVAEPPFDVPESSRSKKSQSTKDTLDAVYHETPVMHEFCPDRWINPDTNAFQPNALPRLAFSSGPRACFGKRLAMQELRIMLTLLVLSVRLDSIPDDLNSPFARERAIRVPAQCYVRVAPL